MVALLAICFLLTAWLQIECDMQDGAIMPFACIFVFVCSRNVVKKYIYFFDDLPLKIISWLLG